MLRSIEMKLFRGIKEGKLEGLTSLVVLVGPNGSGKSAVLDAILIGTNPNPAEGIGQTVQRREGIANGAPWLFWKRGSEGAADLSVNGDSVESRFCNLTLSHPMPQQFLIECKVSTGNHGVIYQRGSVEVIFESVNRYKVSGKAAPWPGVPKVLFVGPFPKYLQTPLHELFSNLARQGLRGQINEIVGALVPGFQQTEILTEEGSPVLYLLFADRAVPVALAGDGIASLVRLASEMVTHPGGIVLMEEPEIHMHPGAIRQLARVIVATVRRDVQVVLTTHSLELIDALLSESSRKEGDIDKLSVYRFGLKEGVLKSSRISGPDVAFARGTIENDLR